MNTSPIFTCYLLLRLSSLFNFTLRMSVFRHRDLSCLREVTMLIFVCGCCSCGCHCHVRLLFALFLFHRRKLPLLYIFHLMFVLCYSCCWECFHCPSRAHSLRYHQHFHYRKCKCSRCSVFVENTNVHCLPVYTKQVIEVVYHLPCFHYIFGVVFYQSIRAFCNFFVFFISFFGKQGVSCVVQHWNCRLFPKAYLLSESSLLHMHLHFEILCATLQFSQQGMLLNIAS